MENKNNSNFLLRKSPLEFSHCEIQETLKKLNISTIVIQAITASWGDVKYQVVRSSLDETGVNENFS